MTDIQTEHVQKNTGETIEKGHIQIKCECKDCDWRTDLIDEPTAITDEEAFYVLSQHFDTAQTHADTHDHRVIVTCYNDNDEDSSVVFEQRSIFSRLIKHSNRSLRQYLKVIGLLYAFFTPLLFLFEVLNGFTVTDSLLLLNLVLCTKTLFYVVGRIKKDARMRYIYEQKTNKDGGVVW